MHYLSKKSSINNTFDQFNSNYNFITMPLDTSHDRNENNYNNRLSPIKKDNSKIRFHGQ